MKKFAIVTHVYATGPSQDLKEYLNKNKANEVIFVGHPLFYAKNLTGSGFEVYADGDLSSQYYQSNLKIPMLISYLWSFFMTIIYGVKFMWETDLYIGCNNLNALAGLVLRRFGVARKVVYYVIDYNPKRFTNKYINWVYHKVDQLCVNLCNETWNLSPRMEEGRKQFYNFSGGHQKTVPIGVWYDRIPRLSENEIEKHTAVFQGHLLEKQGVQYVINAIPQILQEIPDFRLVILGDGPYRAELEKLVKKLNVSANVVFKGYIEKHEDLEKELCKCAIAFALYNQFDENGDLTFTYFADPAKIKDYLASGLPVLMTDVSYNAREIVEKECGLIIDQEPENISNAVVKLLKDSELLKKYRNNAMEFAKTYNWNNIFDKLTK